MFGHKLFDTDYRLDQAMFCPLSPAQKRRDQRCKPHNLARNDAHRYCKSHGTKTDKFFVANSKHWGCTYFFRGPDVHQGWSRHYLKCADRHNESAATLSRSLTLHRSVRRAIVKSLPITYGSPYNLWGQLTNESNRVKEIEIFGPTNRESLFTKDWILEAPEKQDLLAVSIAWRHERKNIFSWPGCIGANLDGSRWDTDDDAKINLLRIQSSQARSMKSWLNFSIGGSLAECACFFVSFRASLQL